MKQNKGFTLIELMAVIAIVSILAIVALGAYQDYVVRSKVGEGMVFAAEAKSSVSDFYYTRKSWPQDNADAGLPTIAQYEQSSFNYVHYVEITSLPREGSITVKFKIPGTPADNKLLQLIPNTMDAGGVVYWTCIPPAVDGLSINQVPANCRG